MTHDLDGFADQPRLERFTPSHDTTTVDDGAEKEGQS